VWHGEELQDPLTRFNDDQEDSMDWQTTKRQLRGHVFVKGRIFTSAFNDLIDNRYM
jgi:hypothetical protein